MRLIKKFLQWRKRRARRREVAAQLRKFAIEGRALVDLIIAKGNLLTANEAALGIKTLAQCDYLDDLALKTLSGEVEPRSLEEAEKPEWPEVVG